MSIEVDIANALANRIIAAAPGLGLPLAMPNIPFPPSDHPEYSENVYLDIKHFRNTNLSPTWGNEKTLLGLYQISIVDPRQAGEISATAIASQIIDLYAKNSNLFEGSTRVLIYEQPSLLSTVQSGQKSIYPVSIPYRCFKA